MRTGVRTLARRTAGVTESALLPWCPAQMRRAQPAVAAAAPAPHHAAPQQAAGKGGHAGAGRQRLVVPFQSHNTTRVFACRHASAGAGHSLCHTQACMHQGGLPDTCGLNVKLALHTAAMQCCDSALAAHPDQEMERELRRWQHELEGERGKLQALATERERLQAAKCGICTQLPLLHRLGEGLWRPGQAAA